MVLCCCFFVSLKIPSSGLVICAEGKGRESWALEKALVVLGRAPLPWHGGVEGQGTVAGQTVHEGFLAFLLLPCAPAGTAVAHEGTGLLGCLLALLQPGQCREGSGVPGVTQAGKGRVSLCCDTQLLPSGWMQHLQSVAISRESPGHSGSLLALSRGYFYHHECQSPAWASWSLQRVWHSLELAWDVWQSVSEVAPESPTIRHGDQRGMTCTFISAFLDFCSSNFQAQAPGYFSYRWLVVCFSRQDEHSPASHAIWAREPSLPLGRAK